MTRYLVLITCFLYSSSFAQLMIAAKEKGKKYGYIDTKGAYVIAPQYDDAEAFFDGYAVVMKDKKYGVINNKNEFVVKLEYDDANARVVEGKLIVFKNKLGGVLDVATGKLIVAPKYTMISQFSEGFAIASNLECEVDKGKQGKHTICSFVVINPKGEEVYTSAPEEFLAYEDIGNEKVRGGKLLCLVNSEGELSYRLIDIATKSGVTFDAGGSGTPVGNFDQALNGLSVYRSGMINIQLDSTTVGYFGNPGPGAVVKDLKFKVKADYSYPFFNGVAVVERNGNLSFIDEKGKTITDTQFSASDYAAPPPMHFNGLIGLFKMEGKKSHVGFVDLKGNVVIPFLYQEYHPFEFDVTPLKFKGDFGLMKKDGTWAVPPKFENLDIGTCPCYR